MYKLLTLVTGLFVLAITLVTVLFVLAITLVTGLFVLAITLVTGLFVLAITLVTGLFVLAITLVTGLFVLAITLITRLFRKPVQQQLIQQILKFCALIPARLQNIHLPSKRSSCDGVYPVRCQAPKPSCKERCHVTPRHVQGEDSFHHRRRDRSWEGDGDNSVITRCSRGYYEQVCTHK